MSFNRAIVECPSNLDAWAASPYVRNQLNEVKVTFQLSQSTYVSQNSKSKNNANLRGSFLFEGPSAAKVRGAKNFISMHMEQQMELMRRERGLRQAQAARDATLKEIEDGLRAGFEVPREMIGLVIGKGGANVNSVKEQTGVERIVVDPEEGVVRVVGHAKEDVERAREMLEYAMEKLTLESEDVGSLLAPSQSGRSVVLNEIRDKAGLVRAQLNDDRSTLELIGTKVAVKSAMMLVKTRLEYRKKISQTQQETDSYYREAADIDYSYGYEHSYRYDDEFPAIGDGPRRPRNDQRGGKSGGRGGGKADTKHNSANDRRDNNRRDNNRRDNNRRGERPDNNRRDNNRRGERPDNNRRDNNRRDNNRRDNNRRDGGEARGNGDGNRNNRRGGNEGRNKNDDKTRGGRNNTGKQTDNKRGPKESKKKGPSGAQSVKAKKEAKNAPKPTATKKDGNRGPKAAKGKNSAKGDKPQGQKKRPGLTETKIPKTERRKHRAVKMPQKTVPNQTPMIKSESYS